MQDLGKVNNRYVRDLRALEVRRFFDMEEKIHVLLQILAGLAALLGLLFLPAVWGVLLFLIWAVQVIFWGFLQEYYPYADRIREIRRRSTTGIAVCSAEKQCRLWHRWQFRNGRYWYSVMTAPCFR